MKPFQYIAPTSVEEALAAMAQHVPEVKALAGGTDLLVELKEASEGPVAVVDLGRVAELRGVTESDDGLTIGALTTHSEILHDPLISRHAPAMQAAARTIGAVQTRNMGTLGGNLVTAVPSLDSGPVLVALDAAVTIAGPEGRRRIPLTDFFVGPRRTALEPGELLVEVIVPRRMLGRPQAFWKFGLRKGQALALVNAAATLSATDGHIADSRVALGAVAPTVIRARGAEAIVDGTPIHPADQAAIARAADVAAGEASPINDFRASADYRRELIRAGTRRVLNEALEEAAMRA